ncbi:hypothetical protein BM1_01111 [Bipolaris maydis]|nr:hypothetical protein BM1_01111 [Bipolaris maydis]
MTAKQSSRCIDSSSVLLRRNLLALGSEEVSPRNNARVHVPSTVHAVSRKKMPLDASAAAQGVNACFAVVYFQAKPQLHHANNVRRPSTHWGCGKRTTGDLGAAQRPICTSTTVTALCRM